MKLYMEPIEVKTTDGLPTALRWRKRVYRVQAVLERWTWRGRWWTDAHGLEGERRLYYRLACDRAQVEIFQRSGTSAGLVSRHETGLVSPHDVASARPMPPWILSRALD